MSLSARKIAQDASFQAFANCYLREVDGGTWHTADVWRTSCALGGQSVRLDRRETHVVELELDSQEQTLALGVRFRSQVGRHTLTSIQRRRRGQREWQELDSVSAELLLIDALYAEQPESEQRLELLGRVIESHQVMTEYVAHHLAHVSVARARGLESSFIESEQSVALGHWLHPTPKSRQGMHGWHHAHFAPELGGRFQLHFFAVERGLVIQESILDATAEELSRRLAESGPDAERFRRLAEQLGDGFCFLPVHPLQAQWLLHQEHVRDCIAAGKLVELGRFGPAFTPTSSVRTLYSDEFDLMIKLSIPVKITNSLRINLQTELGDSVWISKLLREVGLARDFPELRPIEDPAYLSLALPEREETGFEIIFRSNPFGGSGSNSLTSGCLGPGSSSPASSKPEAPKTVHSIAALVQDPITEGVRSKLSELVRAFAGGESAPLEEASRRWFDAYWKCAIEAPLRIYDRHGIALEAHQQNSLLEFDERHLPRICYYRDIQGLALTERFREELIRRVPELEGQTKVFEDDDIVRNGLGYYLVFNQLYAVINRFALDGLLDEGTLVTLVRRKLLSLRADLGRLGAEFIDTLLEKKTVPCKANLLTRIADMDELQSENELAVYAMIDNPLHHAWSESAWNLTGAGADGGQDVLVDNANESGRGSLQRTADGSSGVQGVADRGDALRIFGEIQG